MQYRHRLRSRIVVSIVVLGTVLSGLFALSTLFLQNYLEDELIGETLAREIDAYVAQLRTDPTSLEPFYTQIEGYVTRPGDPDRFVSAQIRNLDPGVHEVETPDGVFKAAVVKEDEFWVFLTYDISENRKLTRQLLWALIGVVVLFSMLSLAMGVWSSRRVMRPVTDLAERLESLGEQTPPPKLAPYFADDEVGELAATLDHYAERLHQLVERDREFNADVSHELRTPLAVISGATELLLAQKDLPEKTRTRLLRIARASRQSTDITTALLHLVRAERGTHEDSRAYSVRDIAEQIILLHEPLMGNKDLDLRVVEADRVNVIAPESVISVVLGNLIGNAVRYTPAGEILITVGAGKVLIEDTGPGIPEEELEHVFERHFRGEDASGKGSGLGLAIVKRLCELYGWSIGFSNRESGGLRAELRFFGR